MSRGFVWFAQNNTETDYVDLSIRLAKSIKRWNKQNKVCVITDQASRFTDKNVDVVRVLQKDYSDDHEIKWANEYQAFSLTPFTHTIKLEADMLWTANTDWWWYHLWQHDLVFSVHCRNYRDKVVKTTPYRTLFVRNKLPNIYNGLMYFRKSKKAQTFFKIAETIATNWEEVKKNMLISCHDQYPSTDVVFALAQRIMDPTNKNLVDYPWFKFIHHKAAVHGLGRMKDHDQYLMPLQIGDRTIIGSQRTSRVWHYHNKNIPGDLDARIF